jgi:hypothetical protein
MKANKLAAALMRDRERPSKKPSSIDCFLCERSKWRNGRRVSKRARFCDGHSPHSRKTLRKKRELDLKGQVQAAE